MNQQSTERWEEMRAKGKMNFIIHNGVLRWGLGAAILFAILKTYTDGGVGSITFHNTDFVQILIIALVIFPIGGYFWGNWVWNSYAKKYSRK
jgi:hypothetical protein